MRSIIIASILSFAVSVFSAETNESKATFAPYLTPASFETYATVSYQGVSGKPTAGGGASLGFGLSPTVALVGWAETDDLDHATIDRAGGGIRLTGRLGKVLRPFAQVSIGYAFDSSSFIKEESFFVRPQFGANLDLWKWNKWHLSLTGSAGYDIDWNGNADFRLFGGLNLGKSF